MGLFGFGAPKVRKHVERVANKRAYAPERMESILVLGEEKTPEAVAGLLARFSYRIDPSITDQEEKDAAFQGICAAGELARPTVLQSLRTERTNVAWQLRILSEILPESEFCEALIQTLGTLDTDYERDPEKKLALLAALEERRHPGIVQSALPFLADASERVRFAALRAIAAQPEREAAARAVTNAVQVEDSLRVLAQMLDLIAEAGWSIEHATPELRARLPQGYSIDAQGKVVHRS